LWREGREGMKKQGRLRAASLVYFINSRNFEIPGIGRRIVVFIIES
jgi:hypothetical protein